VHSWNELPTSLQPVKTASKKLHRLNVQLMKRGVGVLEALKRTFPERAALEDAAPVDQLVMSTSKNEQSLYCGRRSHRRTSSSPRRVTPSTRTPCTTRPPGPHPVGRLRDPILRREAVVQQRLHSHPRVVHRFVDQGQPPPPPIRWTRGRPPGRGGGFLLSGGGLTARACARVASPDLEESHQPHEHPAPRLHSVHLQVGRLRDVRAPGLEGVVQRRRNRGRPGMPSGRSPSVSVL